MRITLPYLMFIKERYLSQGLGVYCSYGSAFPIQQSRYTFLIRYLGDISPICYRVGSFLIGWREPLSAKPHTSLFPKDSILGKGNNIRTISRSIAHSPSYRYWDRLPFLSVTLSSVNDVSYKQNKLYTLRITIK